MAQATAQAPLRATRTFHAAVTTISEILQAISPTEDVFVEQQRRRRGTHDAFWVLFPLIIVMSTFLLLMTIFLICVLAVRRRRGISLRDTDGPVDLSREDLIQGEGGFDGVESRWLESTTEVERREYLRAKDWQLQYPPNSWPTDITLSQFLSIQEKGVSAWSFEPDYETISSVLVHARTEITFLPDPESASSVQSNLPLPKLNEVYYWEAKLFDLPATTNIAIGLATKPYPPFRLPGMSRHSIAYHSNGDKSYNWPFTASTFSEPLKEGDVLGLGYRPRTGTVFFTRNGFRTQGEAFVGLSRFNLFPTVGADGPCSIHINLGQSGFVFIEANVKKWGLAPSVGTLAPPPAYGSERGSILLALGGEAPSNASIQSMSPPPGPSSPPPEARRVRRSQRQRRPKTTSTVPVASSPLRTSSLPTRQIPDSPPPPITPIIEESDDNLASGSSSRRYISPTDLPFHAPANARLPSSPTEETPTEEVVPGDDSDAWSSSDSEASASRASTPPLPPRDDAPAGAPGADYFGMSRRGHVSHHSWSGTPAPRIGPPPHERGHSRHGSNVTIQVHGPPPESPMTPNPPTPNARDIDLGAWTPRARRSPAPQDTLSPAAALTRVNNSDPPPPGYSPLDPFAYGAGVQIDLPAEVIAAALEGGAIPQSAIGQSNTRAERRSRREGRSRH